MGVESFFTKVLGIPADSCVRFRWYLQIATDWLQGERNMKQIVLNIWKDDSGQDLIEYALMAGFVAVAAGAIMPGFLRISARSSRRSRLSWQRQQASPLSGLLPGSRKGREALSGLRILREMSRRKGGPAINAPRRVQRVDGRAGRSP